MARGKLLNFSEAVSLGLHAGAYLAHVGSSETVSVSELASVLKASEHHLAKVLQRLGKSGLVAATRGPRGGYRLARPAAEITLLQVFEAIEGPFQPIACLFDEPICPGPKCLLGNLLIDLTRRTREYLSRTTLADVSNVYEGLG